MFEAKSEIAIAVATQAIRDFLHEHEMEVYLVVFDHKAFKISSSLFDDTCDVIHDRVPMDKVAKMTEDTYFVRGCTALLDAVGGAIHHIGNIHKYARDEDKPEKTLFIITTDGMENASRRYTYAKVKKMVERQKDKYGWEFLFLGTNMDAIEAAGNIGIRADRAATYQCDGEGTALNYEVMSILPVATLSMSGTEVAGERCVTDTSRRIRSARSALGWGKRRWQPWCIM